MLIEPFKEQNHYALLWAFCWNGHDKRQRTVKNHRTYFQFKKPARQCKNWNILLKYELLSKLYVTTFKIKWEEQSIIFIASFAQKVKSL